MEYSIGEDEVRAYDIVKKEYFSVDSMEDDIIYGYILDRARDKKIIKILLKGFKINEGAIAVSFSHNSSKIIAAVASSLSCMEIVTKMQTMD